MDDETVIGTEHQTEIMMILHDLCVSAGNFIEGVSQPEWRLYQLLVTPGRIVLCYGLHRLYGA